MEGYSFGQIIIYSFQYDRIPFLESENGEMVELVLKEFLEGQRGLTQAVFRPSKKLKLRKKYFLKFTEIQGGFNLSNLTRYNTEIGENERVAWEVTQRESDILKSGINLEFEKTNVEYSAEGPEANAIFQPHHGSESEIWYRAEVYDEQSKSSNIIILTEWQGKLQVGHGICAGAFKFNKDGNYKVRFTPMNIDAKELTTTEWTSFESPYKNAVNPFGLDILKPASDVKHPIFDALFPSYLYLNC